jgi:glycosyltransferase involved in cell wall biosynthesis
MSISCRTSLIATVYNRRQYLAEMLDSVLAQTDRDWELILWDDGSVDGSIEIAREYADRDDRIKFVAATHLGRILSLCGAHAIASGEFVGWIDSDDRLHPQAVELTAKALSSNPSVGMVYTQYRQIDSLGNDLGIGYRCQIPYSPQQLCVDFVLFHFRLLRREAFDRCGGIDRTIGGAEDYDLCLRLSEIADIAHLPRILYDYRKHPDTISVTQKAEQTHYSKIAVERAINRRGWHDRYRLVVTEEGLFQLWEIPAALKDDGIVLKEKF